MPRGPYQRFCTRCGAQLAQAESRIDYGHQAAQVRAAATRTPLLAKIFGAVGGLMVLGILAAGVAYVILTHPELVGGGRATSGGQAPQSTAAAGPTTPVDPALESDGVKRYYYVGTTTLERDSDPDYTVTEEFDLRIELFSDGSGLVEFSSDGEPYVPASLVSGSTMSNLVFENGEDSLVGRWRITVNASENECVGRIEILQQAGSLLGATFSGHAVSKTEYEARH